MQLENCSTRLDAATIQAAREKFYSPALAPTKSSSKRESKSVSNGGLEKSGEHYDDVKSNLVSKRLKFKWVLGFCASKCHGFGADSVSLNPITIPESIASITLDSPFLGFLEHLEIIKTQHFTNPITPPPRLSLFQTT